MMRKLLIMGTLAIAALTPQAASAGTPKPVAGPLLSYDSTPYPYDFDQVPVNAGPIRRHTCRISSTGTDPVTITSARLVGANAGDFQFSPPAPAVLAPGEVWEFELIYAPRTTRSSNASLVIISDSINGNVVLDYSGEANNLAPVSVPDAYDLDEDTSLNQPWHGVLHNDSDEDDGVPGLSVSLVDGPSFAQSFTLNPDGSFLYVPLPDYNGPDSFRYEAEDGFGTSDPAVVSLTVRSVIDPPLLRAVASEVEGPTNRRRVPLQIQPASTMPDPPQFIDISEDEDFGAFESIAYTGQDSVEYDLTAGDGERSVFVRLRNSGGTSGIEATSVLIDQTPPAPHPAHPLTISDLSGTDVGSVNVSFDVAFTEAVYTDALGERVAGLRPDAVEIGGTVDASGLQVLVSPLDSKAATTIWRIQVLGSVPEAGTIEVGLKAGSVFDAAGNTLTPVSPVSASLSATVGDWQRLD